VTTYYLGVRPFGDSLISLSLLHRLPPEVRDVKILSTPILEDVAAVTGLARFPMHQVLPHIAAFFDVRVRGPRLALADVRTVRRYLSRHLSRADALLVEQKDWRNGLLTPRGVAHALEPDHRDSIYADRQALIERHFGVRLLMAPSRRPSPKITSMMIHPGARQAARVFPGEVVDNLIAYARARQLRVCLIDPDGTFPSFQGKVSEYLRKPPLEDAIARLRASDLFVGADSFFLHLAYFYGVPLFCIAKVARPYFAPPGMLAQHGSVTLTAARDRPTLSAAIDGYLGA
jgi:hypothetical protein